MASLMRWTTLGDGEGQGGLPCCSPWGRKESDMTRQPNNNNLCPNSNPWSSSKNKASSPLFISYFKWSPRGSSQVCQNQAVSCGCCATSSVLACPVAKPINSIFPNKQGFPGGSVVKKLPANAGDTEDSGLIPELGRSPGGGNGNPLQYSCLGNPKDRGVWWATTHVVIKEMDINQQLSMHAFLVSTQMHSGLLVNKISEKCVTTGTI